MPTIRHALVPQRDADQQERNAQEGHEQACDHQHRVVILVLGHRGAKEDDDRHDEEDEDGRE